MVEMKVQGVGVDTANRPVVVLREASGERQLPIWIGPMEAHAIAAGLSGNKPPRPMTHDLLCSVLKEAGCAVEGLQICDVRESVYYAQLYIRVGKKTQGIDCRPSDGIAVAVRVDAPISIPDVLLDKINSEQELDIERADERGSLLVDPGDATIH
jgi:bifunctional DNase/RNase